jgi:hypothetical protein
MRSHFRNTLPKTPPFLYNTRPSNVLSMNESKLQAISSGNSIYISSIDQKNAETEGQGLRSPRRAVSRECTTRIHFPFHHDEHWAAVQLSISPFDLPNIPMQKFFQCHFRYTWCCGTAPKADIFREVQRIYDCYFQPTLWNFSSEHWYVFRETVSIVFVLTRSAATAILPNPNPLRTKLHV